MIFLLASSAGAGDELPGRLAVNARIAALAAEIEARGYDFKVAPNWVTRLPPDERQKLKSRHPSRLGGRFSSLAANPSPGPLVIRSAEELPAAYDWRDVGGHSYIGPIRNQGHCGACYAFGAGAALEGSIDATAGLYDDACLDLSEACLAFCLDQYYPGYDGCSGSDYDYQELDALTERGISLESVYPYNATDQGCIDNCAHASRYRATAWYRIPCGDIAAIKSAIMAYGVVDAAVLTSAAFDAYAGGIFRDAAGDCDVVIPCYDVSTDHCIALVGWNDNDGDGYWILRNSWSRGWGEDGYMRIAYDAAHVSCAVCYLVVSGISGTVWNDLDHDGVRGVGEDGIAGWKVYVDDNRNGFWDQGEAFALSDSTGKYLITGLPAGDYTVAEEIPVGWKQSFPVLGGVGSGNYRVTVTTGRVTPGVVFGNYCDSAQARARLRHSCAPETLCFQCSNEIGVLYDRADNGDVIQLQAVDFAEDLLCDRDLEILLAGGYTSDFFFRSGMSRLNGCLTVSAGRVTVDKLILVGSY